MLSFPFKLSHEVLQVCCFPSFSLMKVGADEAQFNFYDHSNLILSSHGLLVTHISKHYKMTGR